MQNRGSYCSFYTLNAPTKSLGVVGLVTIRRHGLRLLTLNNEAVGLVMHQARLTTFGRYSIRWFEESIGCEKKLQVMTEGMKILEDVCHEYRSSMAGKYMIVHSVNAAGIVNDTYYPDKLVSKC